jgi:hypothetical protein
MLHAAPWLLPAPLDLAKRDAQADAGDLRAEGLRRLRRDARRGLPAAGGGGTAQALPRGAGGHRLARNAEDAARQVAGDARLGAGSEDRLHAELRLLRQGGREVFRVEGYLRPFHLGSSLDYVASGAYKEQPEFQRFIEARAAARRAKGEKIELMK